jgi:hypothetical protein
MSKPILALIPSGYKSGSGEGTVYSILPNDASGDFDYNRNGNASRVRKDGLIEELTADDTPRLDWYNSECPSLLLEPQRTNLQVYSEQFDNAAWSKNNTSVEANSIISPNGELSADKLINTATSNSYIFDSVSLSTLTNYSFSIFAKKGTASSIEIDVNSSFTGIQGRIRFSFDTEIISNEVGTASFERYPNGWYRLKVNFTTSGYLGGTLFRIWQIDDSVTNNYFYIFGVQLEQGSYCSSYIKTEASTVTRLKDECYNGGDANLFNITEGTFFVDTTVYDSGNVTVIGLSIGNDTQKIIFQFQSNGTQVRIFSSGGVSSFLNLTFNQRNKIAVTFKENEYKFFINGSNAGSDTSATVPSGMDRLNFSNRTNTANNFEGKVYDTRVYDRVLTEAEAIEITTL